MRRRGTRLYQIWAWLAGLWVLALSTVSLKSEQVVFSRILYEPAAGKPQYIELYNNTSNPLDIARWQLKGDVLFEFPDYSANDPTASFLRPFERIVVSAAAAAETREVFGIPGSVRVFGAWRNKLKQKGGHLSLQDKNGVVICSVKFKNGGLWPTADRNCGHSLILTDSNKEVDDWRNWTLNASRENPPGTPPILNTISPAASPEIEANLGQVLVDYDSPWHYNDSGQPLSSSWTQEGFEDSGWPDGPGLLGFDQKPLPKPGLQTQVNMSGQITYYFRCRFNYDGSGDHGAGADRLVMDQILDDGAVYYLNGEEILRTRMPMGKIAASTLASTTVPTASEELTAAVLDPARLRVGTNILAIEVHQVSPNSSDVVFGARLRLLAPIQNGFVINEVFVEPKGGFVEICNTSTTTNNLKGCYLSDTPSTPQKHVFGIDLIIPPRGLAAVSLAECGINAVNPFTLLLTAADGHTVLSAVSASFAEDGRSLGRQPDGTRNWFRFPEPTRGLPNPHEATLASAKNEERIQSKVGKSDVVINEIMFDPPYRAGGTEFVEIFNRGTNSVDISHWRFQEGLTFEFPESTQLPAGGYLAVAANAQRLKSIYGDLPIVGDFHGHLRHRGELLRLTDAAGNLINEVDFKTGGDWPRLPHGGGSSLELYNPWMDNTRSSAWRASIEGNKTDWRTYACTNVYLEQNPMGEPTDYRELHFYLVGAGHVALRNIGLWKKRENLLDHPERMSTHGNGAEGWLALGTHWASGITNGELHILSDGRGDNRADHVEIDCVRLRRGEKYELRFEARWISGCPRMIAETWDHSIGASFLLEIPTRLGTPGQVNSVSMGSGLAATQPTPQLDELLHAPPVPHSSDNVHITTKVTSAVPLTSVRLCFRSDSSTGDAPWISQRMFDDGTHGDSLSGDGLYTAELTEAKTNGQIIQFYVRAVAANRQIGLLPRDGRQTPAMFVVDDQKLPRDLRLDRFIVSAYDLDSMRKGESEQYGFHHPRLSNHRYNMTFISNEEKVFYGGEIRISGSPFTRGRSLSKAKWGLPADRPFRGRTKFYFDNDSHLHNRLCRYLLYQLGHVTCEAEWIRVVINSGGAYIKEDTEPVTSEFVGRVFPEQSGGDLYRIDDEWWFTDGWSRRNRDADWSYKNTDDPLQYRTEWQKHSHEVEDDYSALIQFFKTYSANQFSQQEIDAFLDPEANVQLAAVRGYISDWDSFTMFRGKNGYFYRHAADGRFQFLQWDSDLAFRPGNYPFYGPRVASWLGRPRNRDRFEHYLQELVQFSESQRLETWFELEAAAVPARPVNADFYRTFFQQRNRQVSLEKSRGQIDLFSRPGRTTR